MTKTRITQISLILAALVIFVLLFIAPRTHQADPASETAMMPKNAAAPADMELFVRNAIASLNTSGQKADYDLLVKQAEKNPAQGLDSLVKFWDKNRRPDMAAYFSEKIASHLKTAAGWIKAGDRYYYSIQFVKDISEVGALYSKAMACYTEGLKLEPGNVDAKIQLASCYVDQSIDPMKGIAMLREVEKTDSNNVKLQMTFALFSVKSGQFDKAIKRFEKVVRIDPSFIEAYLHMADAYDQMGDKAKTIEMLEKYESLTTDMFAKKEVRKSIEELKKR